VPTRNKMYKIHLILYICHMSEMSITNARAEFPTAIAKAKKSPVHILKHGKPVAVLIGNSLYEKMLGAMEELDDIATFDRAIKDKSKNIPWESIKKELGLS